MDIAGILTSPEFGLFVIPVLIFCARIIDVSLGTVRVIFTVKGFKHISALIGFFEVMVWLLAVTQIMRNLTNWANYVAYAGGFAAGTFAGIVIEERLAMGSLLVRVITKKNPKKLRSYLRKEGYDATILHAVGGKGASNVVITVVKRKDLKETIGLIRKFSPNAFYSVEDLRAVSRGNFPPERGLHRNYFTRLRTKRKGK